MLFTHQSFSSLKFTKLTRFVTLTPRRALTALAAAPKIRPMGMKWDQFRVCSCVAARRAGRCF